MPKEKGAHSGMKIIFLSYYYVVGPPRSILPPRLNDSLGELTVKQYKAKLAKRKDGWSTVQDKPDA